MNRPLDLPPPGTARFGAYRLTSHLQPIVSFSYGRTIGYEALMRGADSLDRAVPPMQLLAEAEAGGTLDELDHLARRLHLESYERLGLPDGWLFLNLHPRAFARLAELPASRLARSDTLPPNRIVIEIMEDAVKDDARFEDGVALLRRQGWGIALDDFGAGHSNFDRVWRIKPDIVKLDRSYADRSSSDRAARRMLPSIVSLLHEAGSLVLLEGIETADQAMIAMDADIDFGQGYYFARPAPPEQAAQYVVEPLLNRLWPGFDAMRQAQLQAYRAAITPYLEALRQCAARVLAGDALEQACAEFLHLENSERCFLLNPQGYQFGPNVLSRSLSATPALAAFQKTSKPRWSRRPYFHRALNHPGEVQITRPYRSIATSNLCVTVSVAISLRQEWHVLCGDLLWCDAA
jgi:EAL domain-containing protein (putative c-di-GMP-specific phosphodiesterase class I)